MRRRLLLQLIFLAQIAISSTGCGLNCPVAPAITGSPVNATVNLGQPALFTIAASGSEPLRYQWLRDGAPIPGANDPSYSITSPALEDSGSKFSVRISNAYGSATSSAAQLIVSSAKGTTVRYVAPNGSDTNPGTLAQPYQTIQACALSVGSGWTCEVREGTYRETVTPNSGITIEAYPGETAIVDGSDPIRGWVPYQGSIYKTKVSLRGDDTNQIFVGDQMMTEARWPNGTDLFRVNWAKARSGTTPLMIVDSSLPSLDWTGAKIHLWSGRDAFGNQTGTVTNSATGRVSIDVGKSTSCPYICPGEGGYYYLFGTLKALDSEQEWYYDSPSSTLYFIAPGKRNPNNADVRAKVRDFAFDLRGKTNVTIRNMRVFAATVIMDSKSSENLLDGINAKYVSHFTSLASNEPDGPEDAGGFSINMVHTRDTGIILDGSHNTVENSSISFSAGAGIAILGNGNIIENNLIQNIDYVGDYGSGIELFGTGNTIHYNTIHDVGRIGIFIFNAQSQDIEYNNLYNAMMLSHDGGEIYACCVLDGSGTQIHHNWIHDTTQIVPGPGEVTALAGVYIDNGSFGFDVNQNVLWNNKLYNIVVNGLTSTGPNNNFVHNNTIPDNSSGGFIAIQNVANCSPLRVSDNLVVINPRDSVYTNGCVLTNNNHHAPGATEMIPPVSVGCRFAGCSSLPPPAILPEGEVTACPFLPTQ